MRPPRIWLLAFAPAAVGAILYLLLKSGRLRDDSISLAASLGDWVLLAGIILSACVLGVTALVFWLQRRSQQALQAERERSAAAHHRFVRGLDHELKNPLTAIRTELANLADPPSGAEQHRSLASVSAQTERLGRLVADLRKLADLETRPLELVAVNISELVQEAVDLARQTKGASERRITISIPQAPWPLPSASGDRDLLFLAIYNLVDNAVKFTRAGDTIEVRAIEDGAAVAVEVADTGLGISADDLPHIFEELYRSQAARGIEGSGLGLALVQAVAARHSGSVRVRSRPGQGSIFTLRLPVSATAAPQR